MFLLKADLTSMHGKPLPRLSQARTYFNLKKGEAHLQGICRCLAKGLKSMQLVICARETTFFSGHVKGSLIPQVAAQ